MFPTKNRSIDVAPKLILCLPEVKLNVTDKLIYLAHIGQYVRNILSNGSALVETILPRL